MTALKKGFTLIELLIVIAILGVLAVVILIAINPQEQLARTRDAGRTSSVTQLGHALQAYYTARDGTYLDAAADWIDELVSAGEMATVPGAQGYSLTQYHSVGCTGLNIQNGYCYDPDSGTDPTEGAIVFTALESSSNNDRCDPDEAWMVFDTVLGRGGIVCEADGSEPGYNVTGQDFIN